MSNVDKVKDETPKKVRSSPRLNAVKQQHLKKGRQSRGGNNDVLVDPYGAATGSKDVVRKPTGFIYDSFMTEHYNPWDNNHVEKPERMKEAFARCKELGLVDRCQQIPTRLATDKELMLIHSEDHLNTLKEICALAANPETLEDAKLQCISKYQGVYVNGKTLDCTRMAAAAAIDLVENIVKGDVTNGLALVRPPGHHAMTNEFNGFCLCNNVAIAAKNAVQNLGVERVLIVDFDAHHGQATQRQFYDSSKVLYISIHRYEHGNFWPNLRESNFDAVGKKDTEGQGYNVNFPLNEIGMGDSEYLAMFHQVIMPLAYEFSPNLVLVSAGFDAAFGCPEGCMRIMPATYGHFISTLSSLANGKVAVVLEGGYFVPTVAEGSAMCLRALLGDYNLSLGKMPEPKASLVDTILNVLTVLKPFWTFLRMQDEYDSTEVEDTEDINRHKPVIEYRGEGLVEQLYSTVYDPKLHYAIHSPEKLAELIREFQLIQSSYETNLNEHKIREKLLAVAYDVLMMRHKNVEEPGHPEKPARIEKIFETLKDFGIMDRPGVIHLPIRRVTDEEILLVHDESQLEFIKSIPIKSQQDLNRIAERLDSIYLNPDSADCALLAAGCLLELVDAVVQNHSENGLAVIRPPGHHAEADEANGFCLLNNVAMAAKYALETHHLKRILIVDWDVHHGNGIQNMFYQDPRVLYISLHRYDGGTFFPGKPDANFDFVGSGTGEGFNINIPWNGPGMGDAEYLMAFFNVILPVAYQFNPELVLVASGFDAAWGDPLGKCKLSPEMYGHMTHHLRSLANGKMIIALEGGYNLNSISYSMTMCAKALIGDPLPPIIVKEPLKSAKASIKNVIRQHSKYWSCLKYGLSLPDLIPCEAVLPEAAVKSASCGSGNDSPYIPFQYGVPSSTSGTSTVTASRHLSSNDKTSDTKEYFNTSSTTDPIDIRFGNMNLSGELGLAYSSPTIRSTDYMPCQYGTYAPASHTYTFSTSAERSTSLVSTNSKQRDDSSKKDDQK